MERRTIRALFVDDEPLILRALARMASSLPAECQASFCASGEEALDLMTKSPFDVLVCDMRMPGMDGAAVLTQAERRFPETARVILSGFTQYEVALRALPICHRFVSKPLRAEDLRMVLTRTVDLHALLSDPALRKLVGSDKDLPTRPQVYFQLRGALADPSSSLHTIARIVERDAGVTGRVMRAVNNAFFAPARRITSAQEAVSRIGTDVLTGLVLSLECSASFEDALLACSLEPDALERKAYLAASITHELLTDKTQRQDAFLAALLQDAGLLLSAAKQPALVAQAVRLAASEDCSLPSVERRLWGTSHGEIGAYLLGLWGLPYPVVDAVARCYAPEQHTSAELDVPAAVYLAAALAEAALRGDTRNVQLDQGFLARKHLAAKLPELIARVDRIHGVDRPTDPVASAPS
jgi:HD-like signal output (HDOD) protein/ActR/RegA family two-component response regulator